MLKGVFTDETRAGVLTMVTRLRDEEGAVGVILGGTELPLLMTEPEIAWLPTLDTTALHVKAIVQRLRAADQGMGLGLGTGGSGVGVRRGGERRGYYTAGGVGNG